MLPASLMASNLVLVMHGVHSTEGHDKQIAEMKESDVLAVVSKEVDEDLKCFSNIMNVNDLDDTKCNR